MAITIHKGKTEFDADERLFIGMNDRAKAFIMTAIRTDGDGAFHIPITWPLGVCVDNMNMAKAQMLVAQNINSLILDNHDITVLDGSDDLISLCANLVINVVINTGTENKSYRLYTTVGDTAFPGLSLTPLLSSEYRVGDTFNQVSFRKTIREFVKTHFGGFYTNSENAEKMFPPILTTVEFGQTPIGQLAAALVYRTQCYLDYDDIIADSELASIAVNPLDRSPLMWQETEGWS